MLSKLDEFQFHFKMDADYMPAEYENDLFHYTWVMCIVFRHIMKD